MNVNDHCDQAIVKRAVPKWLAFACHAALKRLLRAFVERAKERGFINSYSYHELHAMIERIF